MKLRIVFDYEECLVQLPDHTDPDALREGFFLWLMKRTQAWADTPCGGICATFGSGDFLDYLNEAVLHGKKADLLDNGASADLCLRL